MHHYDNYLIFKIALPVLPREFEKVSFYFAKAKVGIDYFWVQEVKYIIEENYMIVKIELEGGFLNRYGEFILDKAKFQGKIGYMDLHKKYTFELDDLLKKIYAD